MQASKSSSADKRFFILIAAQCVSIALVVVLVVSVRSSSPGDGGADRIRDTAAKLQAAGLTNEAILHYEEYLKQNRVDSKTRANVSFSIAQMQESQGRPEKALAWYYQVEGSPADSAQQKEASKKIVALLESLGRHQAAKSVLNGATSLEKTPEATGKPIAQIGDRKITLEQVDAAFDASPPQLKQAFEGPEGKKNFVRKYVGDELLFEKAKRLQYDSDPKWLKDAEEIKRQYLVNRILNEEVFSKVSVDEKDLKNYFDANKAKYAQNKKPAQFDKVKSAVEQDYRMEKSQAKYREVIEHLTQGGSVQLFLENVK